MARKRDYKSEYAARKQRAIQQGYSSVRERARVRAKLPPKTSPVPRRIIETGAPELLAPSSLTTIRRANARWSKEHSRMPTSKWDPSFDDEKAQRYYNAYVLDINGENSKRVSNDAKKNRLFNFLVYYDLVDLDTWKEKYLG